MNFDYPADYRHITNPTDRLRQRTQDLMAMLAGDSVVAQSEVLVAQQLGREVDDLTQRAAQVDPFEMMRWHQYLENH